ncbi:hypothetical protein [Actinoplanes sp. NPDC049265]|uniref:hypothetical protein n=1 Tax=Actinoplanes sp. NPDC049265 TaxID=3363902 RepID=UPI00371B9E40
MSHPEPPVSTEPDHPASSPPPPAVSIGPRAPEAAKNGFSVGGIIVVVVGILAVLGFGGIAASSMISTVARDQPQAPPGLLDRLCAEPDGDLCPENQAGADESDGSDVSGGGEAPGVAAVPSPPAATGPAADLPVDTLKPGPDLSIAYLDRYQRLLTSEKPGIRVGEIHLGGRAAAGIIALNQKVHDCQAVNGVQLRHQKSRIIESNDKHTLIAVRVVEVAPSCVTGTEAPVGALVRGTTDVELDFVPAWTTKGIWAWLLTDLHAVPVRPDPLRSTTRPGDPVVRTDAASLFDAVTG